MRAIVLYISYTGLLEPLGQSQVYQYLKELSEDHTILLITYEKPEHLEQRERLQELKSEMDDEGIKWRPFKYHKNPTVPATLWDIFKGCLYGISLVKKHDVDIIHARSYIAGAIAMTIQSVSSVKFVFDMRGFWADERVDAGLWPEDSYIYTFAKKLEKALLERADLIVSLTESGVEAIKDFSDVDTSDTQFEVIPTCVNLNLFSRENHKISDSLTLGYLGSVGTWYLFDEVLDCFSILRELNPTASLKIINQGDHEYIREQIEKYQIPESSVEITATEHENVPRALSDVDAGIFFYKPTFSKRGTSPTKMGEFLALGIPCFTNSGIGDVQRLLEQNQTGVVLEEFDDQHKRTAVTQLIELIQEDDVGDRCRALAEEYYSLENGVEAYDSIYRRLMES